MKKESPSTTKTKEEVLEQAYLSAYDIQTLIPKLSYKSALKIIKDTQEKMKEEKYRIPPGKTNLALTWMVKKDLGI